MSHSFILERARIGSQRVVSMCRLDRTKRIDAVLHALNGLGGKYDFQYTIIGSGKEEKRLRRLINRLQIRDRVTMTGYLPRKHAMELMEENDVFVMTSAPETFGLVYLEAMAKGCITVGSKGQGIDGTIVNGINGFLCEPGNVDGLRKTLETIFALSSSEKEAILLSSWQTAKELSNENVAGEYLRHLETMLKKNDEL